MSEENTTIDWSAVTASAKLAMTFLIAYESESPAYRVQKLKNAEAALAEALRLAGAVRKDHV